MLSVPKASDAKAAAEKRAQEILAADLSTGRSAVGRAIQQAINLGKTSVDDVEVPKSVADMLVAELRSAGYYAKESSYNDPRTLDIRWDGKTYR